MPHTFINVPGSQGYDPTRAKSNVLMATTALPRKASTPSSLTASVGSQSRGLPMSTESEFNVPGSQKYDPHYAFDNTIMSKWVRPPTEAEFGYRLESDPDGKTVFVVLNNRTSGVSSDFDPDGTNVLVINDSNVYTQVDRSQSTVTVLVRSQ